LVNNNKFFYLALGGPVIMTHHVVLSIF